MFYAPDKRGESALAGQGTPYEVEQAKDVTKKLKRKYRELADKWPEIEAALRENPFPRQGSDIITHLKAIWQCNYRWTEGKFRFLYEVFEDTHVVSVFDVGPRADIYRPR